MRLAMTMSGKTTLSGMTIPETPADDAPVKPPDPAKVFYYDVVDASSASTAEAMLACPTMLPTLTKRANGVAVALQLLSMRVPDKNSELGGKATRSQGASKAR